MILNTNTFFISSNTKQNKDFIAIFKFWDQKHLHLGVSGLELFFIIKFSNCQIPIIFRLSSKLI